MNTFDPNHRYSDAAKLARLKNKKAFPVRHRRNDRRGRYPVRRQCGSDPLYQRHRWQAYYSYQQFHEKRAGLCEEIPRCISPGQHRGSVHHLRLYDAALSEGKLCREKNLRTGNCFLRSRNCVKTGFMSPRSAKRISTV